MNDKILDWAKNLLLLKSYYFEHANIIEKFIPNTGTLLDDIQMVQWRFA